MTSRHKDTAMIFGASRDYSVAYIKALHRRLGTPLVICADGGLKVAVRCGIAPDIAAGDGDSQGGGEEALPEGCERYRYPSEKDDTDLKICADLALKRGCRKIYLVAATGRRADHYFANAGILEYLHEMGAEGALTDRWNMITYYPGRPVTVSAGCGYSFFSILPLDERLCGVTIQSARYPLDRVEIIRKTPLTISNEPQGEGSLISIEKGRALIILSRD